MIFVFESGLAGIHFTGSALVALLKHSATFGEGLGHHGNSYALPTKCRQGETLSTTAIRVFVGGFIKYATAHPELEFQVTRIGCGIAGYKDRQMAPLFLEAPANCHFDTAWKPILGNHRSYWGHMA